MEERGGPEMNWERQKRENLVFLIEGREGLGDGAERARPVRKKKNIEKEERISYKEGRGGWGRKKIE